DTVLGSFEHVHALLVDVGGVVNHVHTRFQREVDGFTATGVRTDLDATAVGFVDCDLELFFSNKGLFCRPGTGDFFAGDAHLDVVDARADRLAYDLAHALNTVGDLSDAVDEVAGGRSNFHTVSAVSGSGHSTGVDRVADDDVEACFGAGSTEAHGVAVVYVGLCRVDGGE